MAGHRKFSELRERLDKQPGRTERKAKARADLERELAEYDATLAALRRARGMTQQQLAAALGVSQPEVSRVESQADLYLSTLRSYVEAMGGTLELVASFEDGREFPIEFEDLRPEPEPEPAVAGRRR